MPSDVGMYRRVLRASIIARTVSKIRKVSVKKKTLALRARDTGTFLFAKKKIRHHASFEGGVVAEGVDPAVSARDEVEVDDARGAGAGTGACACGAPAPLAISVARAETSGSSRPCALASAMRARARATTSSVWSESPRADPFPGAAFSASSSTSSASPPPQRCLVARAWPAEPEPLPLRKHAAQRADALPGARGERLGPLRNHVRAHGDDAARVGYEAKPRVHFL